MGADQEPATEAGAPRRGSVMGGDTQPMPFTAAPFTLTGPRSRRGEAMVTEGTYAPSVPNRRGSVMGEAEAAEAAPAAPRRGSVMIAEPEAPAPAPAKKPSRKKRG